jgi:subtilisin
MARYVMANRRAGKFQDSQKRASRDALERGFSLSLAASVDVVRDLNPEDELARRVMVFEADPEEVAAKAPMLTGDVIVEREIPHSPLSTLGGMRGLSVLSAMLGPTTAFSAIVTGGGVPLHGATVLLIALDKFNREHEIMDVTDGAGMATLPLSSTLRPAALVVLPAGGFWSMLVRNPASGITVDCVPLKDSGPVDWWHRLLGITSFDVSRGAGIKVGVVDTGVKPHGCLSHVESVGAFIDDGHDPDGGDDVDSHGSHVCGIIAARPVTANQRGGVAPGVTLLSARVFPGPGSLASQADIVDAIDHLSRGRRVDLINLSLGADQPSAIEQDAIRDALERGTLCVCAAGNDGGAVTWPARFDETVAVSAVGLKGTAPTGTLAATGLPLDPSKHGADDQFLASFSNFGTTIDCCAPGVAIISTVPVRFGLEDPYAVMDGTSMASPAACGALAALLAQSDDYKELTGSSRAEAARTILRSNCRSIGLPAAFQGNGMPRLP